MDNEIQENFWSRVTRKAYYSLRESCELKGLNYKTSCNKVWLQPNGGIADAYIGGKKMFLYSNVREWLFLDDAALEPAKDEDVS